MKRYIFAMLGVAGTLLADVPSLEVDRYGQYTGEDWPGKVTCDEQLRAEAARAHSLTFSIPFSRIQLADYLNCDRSALSRELSTMQKEGLIDTYRSSFKLLEPDALQQMVQ